MPSDEEKILDVLQTATLDVEENDLGALQVHISKQIAAYLHKHQKRKKNPWPLHIVALSLHTLTQLYCINIFDKHEQLSTVKEK